MENGEPPHNFTEKFAFEVDQSCRHYSLKDIHRKIDRYLPALKKYCETKETGDVEFKKLNLTFTDYFKIAVIFYSDFDDNLYKKIEKYIKNGNIISYEPNDKNGENMVALSYDNLVRIHLAPKDDLTGYLAIVQTLACALSQKYQSFKRPKLDYFYRIENVFVQKVFVNYLKDCGLISNKDYESLCIGLNNKFQKNINTLMEEQEVFKEIKMPVTAKDLNNYSESHKNDADFDKKIKRIEMLRGASKDWRTNNGKHAFKYVLGTVVADVLYDEYKENKKKTMKKFRNYLKNSSNFDTIEEGLEALLGKDYNKKLNDKVFSGDRRWEQKRNF